MHKKEVAKVIFDGNKDRLGLKDKINDKNRERDKAFLEAKISEIKEDETKEQKDKNY